MVRPDPTRAVRRAVRIRRRATLHAFVQPILSTVRLVAILCGYTRRSARGIRQRDGSCDGEPERTGRDGFMNEEHGLGQEEISKCSQDVTTSAALQTVPVADAAVD